MAHCTLALSPADSHRSFSAFRLLPVGKCLCEHRLSFLLGWVPRSGTAGSHGHSAFNFLRSRQTFPLQLPHFSSSRPWGGAPVSPPPRQHLFSLVFIITILVGVKWHLVVVFNFNFQMTNDVKLLFMCLLATPMSSLEK